MAPPAVLNKGLYLYKIRYNMERFHRLEGEIFIASAAKFC
jgi:hypothetical protein